MSIAIYTSAYSQKTMWIKRDTVFTLQEKCNTCKPYQEFGFTGEGKRQYLGKNKMSVFTQDTTYPKQELGSVTVTPDKLTAMDEHDPRNEIVDSRFISHSALGARDTRELYTPDPLCSGCSVRVFYGICCDPESDLNNPERTLRREKEEREKKIRKHKQMGNSLSLKEIIFLKIICDGLHFINFIQ